MDYRRIPMDLCAFAERKISKEIHPEEPESARSSEQPADMGSFELLGNSMKNPRSLSKRLEGPLVGSSRGNDILHHHSS